MTDVDYDKLAYVLSSNPREDVLRDLSNGPAIPSELHETTGISEAHVSRALNELRKKGIVELLVSEDTKKGRMYGLTADGEAVAENLDREDR